MGTPGSLTRLAEAVLLYESLKPSEQKAFWDSNETRNLLKRLGITSLTHNEPCNPGFHTYLGLRDAE